MAFTVRRFQTCQEQTLTRQGLVNDVEVGIERRSFNRRDAMPLISSGRSVPPEFLCVAGVLRIIRRCTKFRQVTGREAQANRLSSWKTRIGNSLDAISI
jgi:hypothetical protein